VLQVIPAAEGRLEVKQAGFDQPSVAGYYAPRVVQTVQAGWYFEVEGAAGWTLAADIAAGAQRAADHGAAFSDWRQAVGLYALLGWTLPPGAELRIEVEFNDAALAPTAVATGGAWRYGSVAAGMRWAWL
jgi:hypothetical protein